MSTDPSLAGESEARLTILELESEAHNLRMERNEAVDKLFALEDRVRRLQDEMRAQMDAWREEAKAVAIALEPEPGESIKDAADRFARDRAVAVLVCIPVYSAVLVTGTQQATTGATVFLCALGALGLVSCCRRAIHMAASRRRRRRDARRKEASD